ncbi:MAG: lysophospholipid acyltransferase family protein [Nitrospinota bacterium]|nr:lysophospholipid acyltransferase family protein [Nitrospinota bacterium]
MRPIKQFLLAHMAAPIARAIIWLLCVTVRLKVEGVENEDDLFLEGKPGIICCWHGRVLYLPYYYRHVRRRNRVIDVLASPSHDGEFVARVSRLFGFGVIRGSSYKNSRTALRAMVRSVAVGRWPGIIADGSRGPALVAQPGSVMLAKITGAPVIPVTVAFDRHWTLNSWDRMIIPKPFAKGLVIHGNPVVFPSGGGRRELDSKREELNRTLGRITGRADGYFFHKPS